MTASIGSLKSQLGRIIPGAVFVDQVDTGQLGIKQSELGFTVVLGIQDDLGAGTMPAGESTFSRALTSTLVITQQVQAPVGKLLLNALTITDTATVASNHPKVVSDLTLTDEARIPITSSQSITSALSLNQAVLNGGTISISVQQETLVFLQIADDILKYRDGENTLTITDTAIADAIKPVSNTLVITQTLQTGITNASLVNSLVITDRAFSNPTLSAENTLVITDKAELVGLVQVAAENTIVFTQIAIGTDTLNESLSNALTFVEETFDPATGLAVQTVRALTQSVLVQYTPLQVFTGPQRIDLVQSLQHALIKASAVSRAATNALTITQAARRTFCENPSNTLILTDLSDAFIGYDGKNTLVLTQTASHNTEKAKGLTSALGLGQALTFLKVAAAAGIPVTCDYTPFIGPGVAGAPTPPPASLPTLEGLPAGVKFRLQFPAVTPTTTLDLRAPNFGNRDRLTFQRILRETRGGTLIVFADPQWPKIQTLVFSFSGIKEDIATSFIAFLKLSLGKEIAIIDHEGEKWVGVITNPEEVVVQDHKESYTLSIQFEGLAA